MPHITVESSAGLDAAPLLDALHAAALALGCFPVGGVRTFAFPAMASHVGDRAPGNGFVQVHVRIAPGRDAALRRRIADALFAAAEGAMEAALRNGRVALQLEVSEFDPAMTRSRNPMIPG